MSESIGFATDPLENLCGWANRLMQTDTALRLAEALAEYATAWQAERERTPRWVKCSERMPTEINPEDKPYLCIVSYRNGTIERVFADWEDDKLHMQGPAMFFGGAKIIAWLENVPEYVP